MLIPLIVTIPYLVGGMLVKLPIGIIYVMNILTCLRHLGSLLNVKSNIVLIYLILTYL